MRHARDNYCLSGRACFIQMRHNVPACKALVCDLERTLHTPRLLAGIKHAAGQGNAECRVILATLQLAENNAS
jgi:hypothetical protein